jgi:hypothetical protein
MELKFKVWDSQQQKFEYFTLDKVTVSDHHLLAQYGSTVRQFTGLRDIDLVEIYSGDVVQGMLRSNAILGEIRYSVDICGYLAGDTAIADMNIETLRVVGNMQEDFYYNEQGQLTARSATQSEEKRFSALHEHAFYESGLAAHGCLEKLDSYALKAIQAYGRILITHSEQGSNLQQKC